MTQIDPQQLELPKKVEFCSRCVMSNQRPRITFNEKGVCSACLYREYKVNKIDWGDRKKRFIELCNEYRSNDGSYDVVVPCSGGKDSSTIAHRLKHEYRMNPLCVTFSPPVYTQIGWKNLRSFIDSGFDHILISPNGIVNRALSRAGFEMLGDHNEIFDHGQMSSPAAVAMKYGIKLVMYGENGEAEYGGTSAYNDLPGPPWSGHDDIYYSQPLEDLFTYAKENEYLPSDTPDSCLDIYRLPRIEAIHNSGLQFHWFGYYHFWTPQENYYYASKHTNFEANPMGRTEGTYSRYAQLDDATDSFLYYMMFIKYGFGRATSDAAHEIRDGHIDRDEAIALVNRFDGEFPQNSYELFKQYLGINDEVFYAVIDRFRLPHIWKYVNGKWELRAKLCPSHHAA